jgi:hypothetical protein
MEIIQGAMEFEDIEYCIADGGEKERERERARDIYLSTPWETICDPLRFPGSAVSAEPESGSGPKAF